jgi:glyoxylase-like metal-dependent hydrolase (beta-lactamase superfamily II)
MKPPMSSASSVLGSVRLAGVALAAAAGLAACSGGTQDTASYETTQLARNVLLVSGPDGNIVVGVQPEGLVVIDGGSAEHAPSLLRAIRRETGTSTVTTLVDTSWLPDRIGLNVLLGEGDTEIVAHFNARQWLQHGADDRAGEGRYEPIPEAGWPDHTVMDEGGRVAFGEGAIELGFLLQANTDSDLYAYFPEANVLVTGGAIRSDRWPMIDWGAGGYLGGLDDAGRTLLAVANDDTIVVPGSGPVMTRAELAEQAEMYSTLFRRVAELVMSAQSPAEAVAARPTDGYHPDWPGADAFVDRAHRSYKTHIRRDPRLPAIP